MPHFDLERFARLDRLITLDAAAEQLQLAPSTLRAWLRNDRVRGHRFSAAAWAGVLDFATCKPVIYLRLREVLRAFPAVAR